MSIILFIIVLALLIFVHELGHFLAAKSSKVRVDEFGIGFPPRVVGYKPKKSETLYSLNWIPLGGFVKIFGEEAPEEALEPEAQKRNFSYKPKLVQIWILAAGVLGNIIAAWILLTIGLMIGLPASVDSFDPQYIRDSHIAVTGVLPDSPAGEVGLVTGDRLQMLTRGGEERIIDDVSDIRTFLGGSTDQVVVSFERNGIQQELALVPELGIVENGNAALGIAIDEVGIVTLPVHRAVWEGGRVTVQMTGLIAVGLGQFFGDIFTGNADLSQVAGPVGIVGLVGDASALGFVYLLSFTALISINLAIINLIPFPALDGGRILFVIIEAIKGSPIRPRIANITNMVGFALLILLMVIVTYSDIVKLVTG